MVDVGELIGGIMSGIARARRDADMTAAMMAEEYKLNSLLNQVAAPRASGGHRGRPSGHFEHRSRRDHAQVRR